MSSYVNISLAKIETLSPHILFILTIFLFSVYCWIVIGADILFYSWHLIIWNDVCNWFSITQNRYFHIQEVSLIYNLLEVLLKMANEFYQMFFRTYWYNPSLFLPAFIASMNDANGLAGAETCSLSYSFHLLFHLLVNILFRIFVNIYRWNCSVVFFHCTTLITFGFKVKPLL